MSLLTVEGLNAHYGDFQALFEVCLAVDEGQAMALVGANGAGKSTLLRSICGLHDVGSDQVRFAGQPVGGLGTENLVRQGVALVPEGRRLFPSLTVEENLVIGASRGRSGPWNLKRIYEVFPILEQRRRVPATSLSGGQQQMVAIGRALMSNPRMLLCDEISLGLAPVVVKDVYAILPQVLDQGTAVLVVEQDIGQAMRFATDLYCLCEGRVVLSGRSDAIDRETIHQAYFGL